MKIEPGIVTITFLDRPCLGKVGRLRATSSKRPTQAFAARAAIAKNALRMTLGKVPMSARMVPDLLPDIEMGTPPGATHADGVRAARPMGSSMGKT